MHIEQGREAPLPHPSRGSRLAAGLARLRDRLLSEEDLRLEVRLFGRPVRVALSPRAAAAAARLAGPLTVEMELYFSCLVRKAVRFRAADADASLPAGAYSPMVGHLGLQFRAVTTRHCALDCDSAPLESMPVANPQAFVPRWLRVDIAHGAWFGDYGY